MDRSCRKLLRQTIYVAEPTGTSRAGDRTHSTPVAALARVEPDTSLQDTGKDGETVVSDFKVITEHAISQTARIWLPGSDPSVDKLGRTPMKAAPLIDENGAVSHYEVFI